MLRGKGALPFDDRPFAAVSLGEEVRPFPARIFPNGGPSSCWVRASGSGRGLRRALAAPLPREA